MCGHPVIEQKPESQIVKTTVIGDFTVSCGLSVVAFDMRLNIVSAED